MEPNVWREMGLTDDEFALIKELIGREPNYLEVGLFAVMWSEHCSYKTSTPVLKLFPTTGPQVLQGPGENAGIVDLGDGLAAAFKMESHNSPSAVEPYEGAATGVGGILRDIFTMGARPMAILNSLRFGPLQESETKWLVDGVVSGISGYGNAIGVPTVGGEVYFHPSYRGNPLVNAMAVGIMKHEDIAKGVAKGTGNSVMVVGAHTGRDGIHGATFSSAELSEESEATRSPVQVGDPFTEKLLMEACLELIQSGAVVGIQDMGAAGYASSSSEMASRGNSGIELDMDLVPRREAGMTPYEIMLSESQERMLVVPEAGREQEVIDAVARWGLEAVVVGKVTDDNRLRLLENGAVVADLPVKALTDEAPVYQRPTSEPEYYQELRSLDLSQFKLENPVAETLLTLLASPSIASKEWIYKQYDSQGGAGTVVGPGSDAAVVQVADTTKGLVMTTDCNSRYVYLDPYIGGAMAVVEAAQNIVCTGGKPLAITDCLNFGNPEKPEVFWQFHKAAEGISAACAALATPVTGGNVSLYNEVDGDAINPTPTIGMVGILDDVEQVIKNTFPEEDLAVLLVGEVEGTLAGSEYLAVCAQTEGGALPPVEFTSIKARLDLILELNHQGLIQAAHDISDGGLAVALAEMTEECGAEIDLASDHMLTALFGEGVGRILLAVNKKDVDTVIKLAEQQSVPVHHIGATGGSELALAVKGEVQATLPIGELRSARTNTLPHALN